MYVESVDMLPQGRMIWSNTLKHFMRVRLSDSLWKLLREEIVNSTLNQHENAIDKKSDMKEILKNEIN